MRHIRSCDSDLDKQFLQEIPNPDQASPAAATSPFKRKRSLLLRDKLRYASGVKLQLQVRVVLGVGFSEKLLVEVRVETMDVAYQCVNSCKSRLTVKVMSPGSTGN